MDFIAWWARPTFGSLVAGPLVAFVVGVVLGWLASWRLQAPTRRSASMAAGVLTSGLYELALLAFSSSQPSAASVRYLPVMAAVIALASVLAWYIPKWAWAQRPPEESRANRRALAILLIPALVYLVWQLRCLFRGA